MIYTTFFVDENIEENAINRVKDAMGSLNEYITNYSVECIEIYDKIGDWYRITVHLETKQNLTYTLAKELLFILSDNWEWNGGETSCDTSSRDMSAKIINDKIWRVIHKKR